MPSSVDDGVDIKEPIKLTDSRACRRSLAKLPSKKASCTAPNSRTISCCIAALKYACSHANALIHGEIEMIVSVSHIESSRAYFKLDSTLVQEGRRRGASRIGA